MSDVAPFHVMALLARARELEAGGRDIIHMEIGEPDFPTPAPVVEAGLAALRAGKTHYTPAAGLPALRESVSRYYRDHYRVDVAAERILITPGGSGALQLVLTVLVDIGQRVLMTDPGYPCNRNFVRVVEGVPVMVPVDDGTRYQLTPAHIETYWDADTVAAMIATPANPTGTLLGGPALAALQSAVRAREGYLVVDEIYHGLTYGEPASTVLAESPDVFVINSFSKFFGMTGWRLGWVVAPPDYVGDLEKLAQNLFLAAPTPAQHAALAAFLPGTLEILETRRQAFMERRDFLVPALRDLGFGVPVTPEGAFYVYADCSSFTDDSFAFCRDLLESHGVAVTPGLDFGVFRNRHYVRFAYTTGMERLRAGVARLKQALS